MSARAWRRVSSSSAASASAMRATSASAWACSSSVSSWSWSWPRGRGRDPRGRGRAPRGRGSAAGGLGFEVDLGLIALQLRAGERLPWSRHRRRPLTGEPGRTESSRAPKEQPLPGISQAPEPSERGNSGEVRGVSAQFAGTRLTDGESAGSFRRWCVNLSGPRTREVGSCGTARPCRATRRPVDGAPFVDRHIGPPRRRPVRDARRRSATARSTSSSRPRCRRSSASETPLALVDRHVGDRGTGAAARARRPQRGVHVADRARLPRHHHAAA